jgi:hypothetical protein
VYGAEAPWRLMGVAEDDFAQRVDLNADLCVVDGEHYFVRGHLEIPVHGSDEPFAWSVWCSLSRESFEHMTRHCNDDHREDLPPYFGWLCTALPTYPSTMHLKTRVHSRKPGMVPTVEVEPTEHPLAVEQRDGMSRRRVDEIAHVLLGYRSGR